MVVTWILENSMGFELGNMLRYKLGINSLFNLGGQTFGCVLCIGYVAYSVTLEAFVRVGGFNPCHKRISQVSIQADRIV